MILFKAKIFNKGQKSLDNISNVFHIFNILEIEIEIID